LPSATRTQLQAVRFLAQRVLKVREPSAVASSVGKLTTECDRVTLV